MTIDEAITHAREKAKEQRSHIGTWDEEYSKRCEECAEEHEQLAEWLEELKMYKSLSPRELVSEKQRSDRGIEYHKGFNNGYNKAIDDFANACKGNIMYKTFGLRECDIEQIAEQLKAGGENENYNKEES